MDGAKRSTVHKRQSSHRQHANTSGKANKNPRKKKKSGGGHREEVLSSCELCGVKWRVRTEQHGSASSEEALRQQHDNGWQHMNNVLSHDLYGETGYEVAAQFGGDGVSVSSKDVSRSVMIQAQRAWELVTKPLVLSCSGWDLYSAVEVRINAEAICVALLTSVRDWDSNRVRTCIYGGPAALLAVAAHIRYGELAKSLHLTFLFPGAVSAEKEMSATVALCVLAAAVEAQAPGLRQLDVGVVEGATGRILTDKRLVKMFVSAWAQTLSKSAGLRLCFDALSLEDEELETLRIACRRGWRRWATSFLLGAHSRVGVNSKIRLLPTVVIDNILSHAKRGLLTVVETKVDYDSISHEDLHTHGHVLPQQLPTDHAMDDLAFVAAQCI